jgi:hypothetical protein
LEALHAKGEAAAADLRSRWIRRADLRSAYEHRSTGDYIAAALSGAGRDDSTK